MELKELEQKVNELSAQEDEIRKDLIGKMDEKAEKSEDLANDKGELLKFDTDIKNLKLRLRLIKEDRMSSENHLLQMLLEQKLEHRLAEEKFLAQKQRDDDKLFDQQRRNVERRRQYITWALTAAGLLAGLIMSILALLRSRH